MQNNMSVLLCVFVQGERLLAFQNACLPSVAHNALICDVKKTLL